MSNFAAGAAQHMSRLSVPICPVDLPSDDDSDADDPSAHPAGMRPTDGGIDGGPSLGSPSPQGPNLSLTMNRSQDPDAVTTLTEERLTEIAQSVEQIWQDRVSRQEKDAQRQDCYRRLDAWKDALEPYDWRNVKSRVIRQVLEHADLNAGFNKRQRLVRAYELLRCLGSDILEANVNSGLESDQLLERIKGHGMRYGVETPEFWSVKEESILRAEIDGWIQEATRGEVSAALGDPKTLMLLNTLGYRLQSMKIGKYSLKELGTLMLVQLGHLSEVQVNTEAAESNRERTEHITRVREKLRGLAERAKQDDVAESTVRPLLQRLLTDVGEEYLRKNRALARSTEQEKTDFHSVAKRPLDFSKHCPALQDFEPRGDAPAKSIEDLTPAQSLDVVHKLVQVWQQQNSAEPMPKFLKIWLSRDFSKMGPAQVDEMNRDLQKFFPRNFKARVLHADARLRSCIERVLVGTQEADIEAAGAEVRGANFFSTPTSASTVSKVTAVFGLAPDGKRAPQSHNPVLLKVIPFQPAHDSGGVRSSDSMEFEIREIGLRINGMYRQFRPDIDQSEDMPSSGDASELRYFEWVPPGIVIEASKPLEHVLSHGVTHVKMVLPLQKDAVEDDPVQISLSDPCEVTADSLSYQCIPSQPRESEFAEFMGFRRYVVQVGPFETDMPLPGSLRCATSTGRKGFVETGKILAQVLPIIWCPALTVEDLRAKLIEKPGLLYFASIALLDSVVPAKFKEALRSHWASVLRLSTEAKVPFTTAELETRHIVLELLIAQEHSADKMCAVLPHGHCVDLLTLLSVTHHPHRILSIERSNFEARTKDVEAIMTDCSLTFVIVMTTGRISPLQLGELTLRARGCVRLIFVNHPSLISALMVTRSIDRVLLPRSIQHAPIALEPVAFSGTSAVGSAIVYGNERFLRQPEHLTPQTVNDDGCPEPRILSWREDLARLSQNLGDAEQWRENEAAWRQRSIEDHCGMLLHLVIADEFIAKKYFSEMCMRGGRLHIFDTNDANSHSLSQVDALLERAPRTLRSNVVAVSQRTSSAVKPQSQVEPPSRLDESDPDGKKHISDHSAVENFADTQCIVMFNIQFVLQSKIEDIIARCYQKGFKVILVLREAAPSLLRVRVSTPGDSSNKYVDAARLHGRTSTNDFIEQVYSKGDISARMFRSLRLALGPKALHSGCWKPLARAADQPLEDTNLVLSAPWQDLLKSLKGPTEDDSCNSIANLIQGMALASGDGTESAPASRGVSHDASTSFAFSVGFHVMSFVRQSPESGIGSDLCFPEFVLMSTCRLLSQVHRVEAWLRYMSFSHGKFSDATQELARDAGVPLLQMNPSKHFIASNWKVTPRANANSASIVDILTALDESHTNTPSLQIPLPSYVGTGHVDNSISVEEVYEQNTILGRDLDWESFAENWANSSCELTPYLLLKLLDESVDLVKLVLCLSASQICNLSTTSLGNVGAVQGGDSQQCRVLEKLREHLQSTWKLLVAAESDQLQTRLAALKWLLCTQLSEAARANFEDDCGEFSEAELSRLISCNISLCTKESSNSLVHRATRMVVALDGPPALISKQNEVREVLLTSAPNSWSFGDRPHVGCVFIEFLFAGEHRSEMRRLQVGRAVTAVPIFEQLLRWLDRALHEKEQVNAGDVRFTTPALASILERSPRPCDVRVIIEGLVCPVLLEGSGANRIACHILDTLAKRAPHLIVPVLEVLSEITADLCLREAAHPLLHPLLQSLRCKDLSAYLDSWETVNADKSLQNIPLALDASDDLRHLYLKSFAAPNSKRAPSSDIDIHVALLTDPSCAAIFQDLSTHLQSEHLSETDRSDHILVLIWYCWGRLPSMCLPREALPGTKQKMCLFCQALQKANFKDRCEEEGMGVSVVARYLLKPHTLPFAVFNTCADLMPYAHASDNREARLLEHILIVAQEDDRTWPPYCFRWHCRPLPSPLKRQLLQGLRASITKPTQKPLLELYPKLVDGISHTILSHNLTVFLQLSMLENSGKQPRILATCILAWFSSVELGRAELQECMDSSARTLFLKVWEDFVRECTAASMRKLLVYGPLPTYLDVRWAETNATTPLFYLTKESANFTAQWLNMLIMHLHLTDVSPFLANQLVEEAGTSLKQTREGPRHRDALSHVGKSVGNALKRDASHSSFVTTCEDGELDAQGLLRRFAVLADFTTLLNRATPEMGVFFKNMVLGICPSQAEASDDDHSAIIFDTLFLIYGITPENRAIEFELLCQEYKLKQLAASKQASAEAEFMRDSFYSHMPEICQRLRAIDGLRRAPLQRKTTRARYIMEVTSSRSGMAQHPCYLSSENFQTVEQQATAVGNPANVDDLVVRGPAYDAQCDLNMPRERLVNRCPVFFRARANAAAAAGFDVFSRHAGLTAPSTVCKIGAPVVSARDLLGIEANEHMYLYGCLRVRPGLQPLLRADGSFLRLSAIEARSRHSKQRDCDTALGQGEDIAKVFANNGDAWLWASSLPAHTTLMGDGFYLKKADDGATWLPVLAGKHMKNISVEAEVDIKNQRYCLFPYVHSHDLVGLSLDSSVLRITMMIVWVAWELRRGPRQREFSNTNEVTPQMLEEPLHQMAVLTVTIEKAALGDADPQVARLLSRYQQVETLICDIVYNTLRSVWTQVTGDSVSTVLQQECRRASRSHEIARDLPFLVQSGPAGNMDKLSHLGVALSELLAQIVSQVDRTACQQLATLLQVVRKGAKIAPASAGEKGEQLIAQHHKITKRAFAKKSEEILRAIERKLWKPASREFVCGFSDSDESSGSDEEGIVVVDDPHLDRQTELHEALGQLTAAERMEEAMFEDRIERETDYWDTQFDREPSRGVPLFCQRHRFGRPVTSRTVVMAMFDADFPLYFVWLDADVLKLRYTMADGLPLAYFIHKNLIVQLVSDARGVLRHEEGVDRALKLRDKLLGWIANILRSPLSSETKTWILSAIENMGSTPQCPPQDLEHVNLSVIAFCLCRCCPTDTRQASVLKEMLCLAWSIPSGVRQLIHRKSDQYGMYIVRGGTLLDLQKLRLQVAVRDFEREFWQRSVNNNSMYLDIISQFSSYCCIVYVQGLPKIDDILLKWLAEYTKHHPWRFIYLENVDTTWNYSENRDRCSFQFALPNPSHAISTVGDLQGLDIRDVRPSHVCEYEQALVPPMEHCRKPQVLHTFLRTKLGNFGNDLCESFFSDQPPASRMQGDFRDDLERHLFRREPCQILLVSPPGAGKTYYMSEVAVTLQRERGIALTQFDGSSDILVTHTLSELLHRAVSSGSGDGKMLILDEYHMLSDEQKVELFEWLSDKLSSLRVVLIANRIDSKDREKLEKMSKMKQEQELDAENKTVILLETRLTRTKVEEVMNTRGNTPELQQHIADWFVASRLVFGEESVSLRLVDTLDNILGRQNPEGSRIALVDLLLNKVPTVSRVAAEDFVSAFLARTGAQEESRFSAGPGGPFAVMFRVGSLDITNDKMCSFTEFLARMPQLYSMPPACRILCWCVYVMNYAKFWDIDLSPIMAYEFVDQVNVPFQLRQPSAGNCVQGRAFSWAGDYSVLDDLIDAVKHGHSIDWADVRRKQWSQSFVTDGPKLCRLLSSARNPGTCLDNMHPLNLRNLLRNSVDLVSAQLASFVLKYHCHSSVTGVDNPYYTAIWITILHESSIVSVHDLLSLTDQLPNAPRNLLNGLLWAREHAQDMLEASCSPAEQRDALLQQALVTLSVCFSLCGAGHEWKRLWTGAFAKLLMSPSLESETWWKHNGCDILQSLTDASVQDIPLKLPVDALRSMLLENEAFEEEWPAELSMMWRVLHCNAQGQEVNCLWKKDSTKLLFLEMTSGCLETSPLNTDVLTGVLHITSGTLEQSLQRHILTTSCVLPRELEPEDVLRMLGSVLHGLTIGDLKIECTGALRQALERKISSEAAA